MSANWRELELPRGVQLDAQVWSQSTSEGHMHMLLGFRDQYGCSKAGCTAFEP